MGAIPQPLALLARSRHIDRVDPNQLLARAHRAFVAGQLTGARRDLETILRSYPGAAPALHLLALVEKRAGRHDEARRLFEATLRVAPTDPQVHNNYGNLLDALGEGDRAADHYRRAAALAPNFADAHLNLGLMLHSLGRAEEALPALERAAALTPDRARPWTALALTLRDLERLDEAEAALDRAEAIAPSDPKLLHARANLVADREGGATALPHYVRAREADPTSLDVLLGEAIAHREAGNVAAAEAMLAGALTAKPDWIAGHEALARMRWQMGASDDFAASFEAAVAGRSRDAALWLAYLRVLNQSQQHEQLLRMAAAARTAAGDHPMFDALEAGAASESGDTSRADAIYARLDTADPVVAIGQARHRLRSGDPTGAAAVLEPTARADLGNALAWAYLGTAWRLLADPRHDWLARQPELVQSLEIDAGDLDTLAALLRRLHVTRVHPFDQTLRGGTQTTGTLLRRTDPELARLREGLEDGIRRYLAKLPPLDAAHPLLRVRRDTFRFTGSWSVRLTDGGYHVQHVHPEGVLSSAFYIVLPPQQPDDAPDAGWLTVGMPPPELGLGLPPLASIEPKPGRLALFPSYLWHGTQPFGRGERLTVAFDVVAPAAVQM